MPLWLRRQTVKTTTTNSKSYDDNSKEGYTYFFNNEEPKNFIQEAPLDNNNIN
jgi:YHS domain-containing protein